MIVKAVILLLFAGCGANPAPDPCETYESKECHVTTESEGCPDTTEYYDKRVDRNLLCCCPCRMGSITDKNSKNTTCFQESIVPSETPTSVYSTTPSQGNDIVTIIVLAFGFGISFVALIIFIIVPTIPEKLNQWVCCKPSNSSPNPANGVPGSAETHPMNPESIT